MLDPIPPAPGPPPERAASYGPGVGNRPGFALSDGYAGPRPSPARPWAPWVIATSAAAAFGNAAVCVLNIVERHYQQQRLTSHPPSPQRIHHILNAIRAFTTFDLVAALAFLVVGVTWSIKRRPRTRLKREGEAAVEPALRRVLPLAYGLLFGALIVSIIATTAASSTFHTGMTVSDFVTYRTNLAIGAGARTVMWACWLPLVARATRLQAEREASSPPTYAWSG